MPELQRQPHLSSLVENTIFEADQPISADQAIDRRSQLPITADQLDYNMVLTKLVYHNVTQGCRMSPLSQITNKVSCNAHTKAGALL